jgi:hypothetical protein
MPKTDGYITTYDSTNWKYSNRVNPDVSSLNPQDEAYWRIEQPKLPGVKCDVEGNILNGPIVDFTDVNGLFSANPEDRSGVYIQWAGISPMELDVLLIVWSVPVVILNHQGFNTSPLAVENISLTGRLMSIKLSGPVAIDASEAVRLTIKKDSVGWYGDKQNSGSEYDPSNSIKPDFDNYIRRNDELTPELHNKVLYLNKDFNELECKCTHPFDLEAVPGCSGTAKIWQVSYELFGSTLPSQVYPLNELKETTLTYTYYGTTLEDVELCSNCIPVQVEIMAIRGPRVVITAGAPQTNQLLPRKSVVEIQCGCDEFILNVENEVPEVEETIGKHYDRLLQVVHFTTTALQTATATLPSFTTSTVNLPQGTTTQVTGCTSAQRFLASGGQSTAISIPTLGDPYGTEQAIDTDLRVKKFSTENVLIQTATGTIKLVTSGSSGSTLVSVDSGFDGKFMGTTQTGNFAATGISDITCYTSVSAVNNVAIAEPDDTTFATGTDVKNVVTSHTTEYLTAFTITGYTVTELSVCTEGGSPTSIFVLTVPGLSSTLGYTPTRSTLPSTPMTGVTGSKPAKAVTGTTTIDEPSGTTTFRGAIDGGTAITSIETKTFTTYIVGTDNFGSAPVLKENNDGTIKLVEYNDADGGDTFKVVKYEANRHFITLGAGGFKFAQSPEAATNIITQITGSIEDIALPSEPVNVFTITNSSSADVLVNNGSGPIITYVTDPGADWKLFREVDPAPSNPYKFIQRDEEVKEITTPTPGDDCNNPSPEVEFYENPNHGDIVLSTPVLVKTEKADMSRAPGYGSAENPIANPAEDPKDDTFDSNVATVRVKRLKRPYPLA